MRSTRPSRLVKHALKSTIKPFPPASPTSKGVLPMTLRLVLHALLLTLCAGPGLAQTEPRPKPATAPNEVTKEWNAAGTKGAVVAGGPEAVASGVAMLRNGGNAADAAAATILAQTVTDANQFCFGGEVPILVYDARRKVVEV